MSNDSMVTRASGSEAPEAVELEGLVAKLDLAHAEVAKSVLGQTGVVEQLFIGLMAGGHVLIEGAPGLGKTLLVRTVAAVCGLDFARIQFTPDLMPADITGTVVLVQDAQRSSTTRFERGPVFAQLVLADEINRATPKTQSALLEAMQEQTVTVAGEEYPLPRPFFVFATQNPIEMEGTYRLPEAQLDRFFLKATISYPPIDILDSILEATTGNDGGRSKQVMTPDDVIRLQALTRQVPMASHVRRAVARFVLATQPQDPSSTREIRKYVRYGISPRGAQSLVLAAKAHALIAGRHNVSFTDVRSVAVPALRHRLQLTYEGVSEEVTVEAVLEKALAASLRNE